MLIQTAANTFADDEAISEQTQQDASQVTEQEETADIDWNAMRLDMESTDVLEEKMFRYALEQYGNEIAAAAVVGNAWHESALCPYRVESDTVKDEYGRFPSSLVYTQNVKSGKIGRDEFAYSGPNAGGYGLFSWTSTGRKENLYDFAKAQGKDIDDWQMQMDFAYEEIKERYFDLYYKLITAQDVELAARSFASIFEQAAEIEEKLHMRTTPAIEILEKYGTDKCESKPNEYFGRMPPIEGSYDYLEQTITKASVEGRDMRVYFAQTVMKMAEYGEVAVNGYFSEDFVNALRKYQGDHGLEKTGELDRETWACLYLEKFSSLWTDENGIRHIGSEY